jgi:predicted ATP-dependent protease
MSSSLIIPPDALKLTIDLADLKIPEIVSAQRNILGQPRAQSALEFGITMPNPGYNVFVMGESGLGRLSMITNHLNELSLNLPTPYSYAYVDNFANQREPHAIRLPPGCGERFCNDIEELIDNILVTFPAVFESPSYQQKKSAIDRSFNQLYNNAINLVEKRARAHDVALFRDNENITFVPFINNKSLDEDQFLELPQAERDAFHQEVEELEGYLNEVLLDLPQWRRDTLEKTKQLDHEAIKLAITPLFAELDKKYQGIEDACRYLSTIKENLNIVVADYLMPTRALESSHNPAKRSLLTEFYLPNILVDYGQDCGAPVIFEPHPTYQNLFGRIEYISEQGTLVTNYRRICPGSLHKANGGYLIVDAEKVLTYPFVWESVKRALQLGCIEIESPYSDLGINTVTLKPENIPLNIKIILVGSRDIYYLLEERDSEFNEMFKVLADFDSYIPLNRESTQQFALRMIKHATDTCAKPLSKSAIRRLIENSCRLSEHQHHLSAHINDSLDIVSEAQVFAVQTNSDFIDESHIEQALTAREYRNGRIPQAILEEMLDDTILIDTEGEAIGKVNGLTILEVGGSSFGAPARITTTVYPGSRGIVDIEREAELGQAIHSKGVMILTGYLGHCYAQEFPLAISANIAIEQSYGYIDGDSASLAELCCLISALTRIPIKQYFAVTGSINQYGEVQAIGGVNEKIEGFFRLCHARGLSGQHAVIIPAANKRNLVLKQEVIAAVSQGFFSIYAVATVDETLELLTGKTVGIIDKDGHYPEDSINFKAISRLKEISDLTSDDDKEETL